MATIGASPGIGAVIYNEIEQAAASADGDTYLLPRKKDGGSDEFIVQVDIDSGEADVMIQCRLSKDAKWINAIAAVVDEVTTLTTAGLVTLSYVPQVRAITTNVVSAPNIRVEIFHG